MGGMKLDHEFFQVSKLGEDQKKRRSSPKLEEFFSPNLSDSDADQSPNYWGGGGCSQIIGGIYIPGFQHPW